MMEHIRRIAFLLLMISIIMGAFGYAVPIFLKYGLVGMSGLYLILFFRKWFTHR